MYLEVCFFVSIPFQFLFIVWQITKMMVSVTFAAERSHVLPGFSPPRSRPPSLREAYAVEAESPSQLRGSLNLGTEERTSARRIVDANSFLF